MTMDINPHSNQSKPARSEPLEEVLAQAGPTSSASVQEDPTSASQTVAEDADATATGTSFATAISKTARTKDVNAASK